MNESSKFRRRLLFAGAVAATAGTASALVRSAVETVTLGQVSLSFYAVTGAVVQEVLERLGHNVVVKTGPHDEMFPLLGQGQIDVMAAAWLPQGHAAYWAQYGADAVEVARLYDGARFFWAVPDYVPQGEVRSIADLDKPAVARRMTKLIQGVGEAAAVTTVSRRAVTEYGLADHGYTLRAGTPGEWTSAYESAIRERRWFVFPTWTPQYLNRDGSLRPLLDPRGVLGGQNRASLVAPNDRFARMPAATRSVLSKIDLGREAVTEMDWFVNVDRLSPREAARRWMAANDSRVSQWFRL